MKGTCVDPCKDAKCPGGGACVNGTCVDPVPPVVDAGNTWVDANGQPLQLAKDENGNLIIPPGAVLRDAAPILGNTKIRVTAVVDLCRFPEVVEAPPAPATPAKSTKGKTNPK